MIEISAADKLACAERELKFRQRVYSRMVAEGKMTAKKQDHELACMRAIVEDYRKAVAAERLF